MTAALFVFPEPTPRPVPNVVKAKAKSKGYTADFEQKVWGPYPRKLNCSKFDAFKAWQRLSGDEQQQAIVAIPIYAASMMGKDEQYLPHCATWLNGKRFETVVVMTRAAVPSVITDWSGILRIYKATGRWNRVNGAEPGHLSCAVPAEELRRAGL